MAIATVKIWNGSEWVDACSNRISVWDGSAWIDLGQGESIWSGDLWYDVVCAGVEFFWLNDDEPACEKLPLPEREVVFEWLNDENPACEKLPFPEREVVFEWLDDESPACEKIPLPQREVVFEWLDDESPACEKIPFPERQVEFTWLDDENPSCEKLPFPEREVVFEWLNDESPACEKILGIWTRTGQQRCVDFGNSTAVEEEFENTSPESPQFGEKIWIATKSDQNLCPVFNYMWSGQGQCETDEQPPIVMSGIVYWGHIENEPTESIILGLNSRNYVSVPGGQEQFDMSVSIGGLYPTIAYPATWPDIVDIRDDSGNDNIYPDMRKLANIQLNGNDYKVYRYDHIVGILENFKFYVKWV